MSQNIVQQDSLEAPLGATAERQAVVSAAGVTPVSYTHLTLPTICSV